MKTITTRLLFVFLSLLAFSSKAFPSNLSTSAFHLSDEIDKNTYAYIESLSSIEFDSLLASLKSQIVLDFQDPAIVAFYMKISDQFKYADSYFENELGIRLTTMAYAIIDEVGMQYQSAVFEKSIDVHNPSARMLRFKMAEYDIYKEEPINNWLKLYHYILDAKFGYIWMKLRTTYLPYFIVACAIACSLLFLLCFIFRRRVHRGYRQFKILLHRIKYNKSTNMRFITKFSIVFFLAVLSIGFSIRLNATETVTHCKLIELECKINSVAKKVKKLTSEKKFETSPLLERILIGGDIYSFYGLSKPSHFAKLADCDIKSISKNDFLRYDNILSDLNEILTSKSDFVEARTKYISQDGIKRETPSPSNFIDNKKSLDKVGNNKKARNKRERYLSRMQNQGYFTERISYKGNPYSVVIIDPNSKRIQLKLFQDSLPGSDDTYNRAKGLNTKIIMNAGMFDDNVSPEPVGLFIKEGKELFPLNTKDGRGNFFLKPNGVFFVNDRGQAYVLSTEEFVRKRRNQKISYATQSGPMLLVDGIIHPKFNSDSPNFNIRNGVGIMKNGNIVLVMSNVPVRFHQLASLFRDRFKCANALYLDGVISQMYAPELNEVANKAKYGPLIVLDAVE